MIRPLSLIAASCLVLTVAGCLPKLPKHQVNPPARRSYVVGATPVAAADREWPSDSPVLLVRPFQVDRPWDGQELIRCTPGGACTVDPYAVLLAPPAELLAQSLRNSLGAGAFPGPVTSDYSTLRPTFILETTVTEFGATVAQDGTTVGVAAARFRLIEPGSEKQFDRLAYDLTFREEVPAASGKSDAVIAAMNEAWIRVEKKLMVQPTP